MGSISSCDVACLTLLDLWLLLLVLLLHQQGSWRLEEEGLPLRFNRMLRCAMICSSPLGLVRHGGVAACLGYLAT
jgi:hypothetical protein